MREEAFICRWLKWNFSNGGCESHSPWGIGSWEGPRWILREVIYARSAQPHIPVGEPHSHTRVNSCVTFRTICWRLKHYGLSSKPPYCIPLSLAENNVPRSANVNLTFDNKISLTVIVRLSAVGEFLYYFYYLRPVLNSLAFITFFTGSHVTVCIR